MALEELFREAFEIKTVYRPVVKPDRGYDGVIFFAYLLQADSDGQERICFDYKARHFKTEKAAVKSLNKFTEQNGLYAKWLMGAL